MSEEQNTIQNGTPLTRRFFRWLGMSSAHHQYRTDTDTPHNDD